MKDLALTIGGTEFPIPTSIKHVVPNTGGEFGQNLLRTGIEALIVIAIVLAIFFMIWGAIQWILSEGDKEKLQKAKNRLTFAIIGLIIALVAFLVINIIGVVFNVTLLK